jgi:hypothetical protein
MMQRVDTPQRALSVTTPDDMLAYAMSKDCDVDKLQKLWELRQAWQREQARMAYHRALADFKGEQLAITKNKLVSYPGKNGGEATSYRHATLGNVVGIVAPALARHDLSHSWDVKREAERVHVTCRLTHALGHSESITMDGPLDTSGSKNNIQAVGSTVTYLERYTLLAITGLATEDQDDDGQQPETFKPEDLITDEQQATLTELLEATGSSRERFLDHWKIRRLGEMLKTEYPEAVALLKQKQARQKAQAAGGAQ